MQAQRCRHPLPLTACAVWTSVPGTPSPPCSKWAGGCSRLCSSRCRESFCLCYSVSVSLTLVPLASTAQASLREFSGLLPLGSWLLWMFFLLRAWLDSLSGSDALEEVAELSPGYKVLVSGNSSENESPNFLWTPQGELVASPEQFLGAGSYKGTVLYHHLKYHQRLAGNYTLQFSS